MHLTTLTTRDPDNELATTLHTPHDAALTALRDAYDIDPEEPDAVRAAESQGLNVQLDVHEIPAALNVDDVAVTSYHGEYDHVPVVQVDAPNGHRVRINLNDAPVYDGDPATDASPAWSAPWPAHPGTAAQGKRTPPPISPAHQQKQPAPARENAL